MLDSIIQSFRDAELVKIVQANITSLKVDAIVNAANTTLLGGGGVDGAIHRAAGPELLDYCRKLKGCPTGEAKISPGFKLPANWVIHTVGPVYHGGKSKEAVLLANCYRNSLELALKNRVRTIAFPSISTGAYGYPKEEAAQIALTVMKEFENQFDEIVACCFGEEDKKLYERVMGEI
jgi:O-acetyl-ADP-ribose deacetylase (regulator of RNase III)